MNINKNKYKIFSFYVILFIFIAIGLSLEKANIAKAFIFETSLKYGDRSFAVMELQKILNQSSDTQVASTGPGSPGEETDYFGKLTQRAVIKFQEKYKNEILVPAGLSSGTGFVGIFTLAKLNAILFNTNKVIATSSIIGTTSSIVNGSSTSIPAVLQTTSTMMNNNNLNGSNSYQGLPLIESLSGIDFSPGDSLTITGAGFISPVSVHIGDQVYNNPKVESNSVITVPIPNQEGVLLVWVSDNAGDSRADYPMFIVVRNQSISNSAIYNTLEIIKRNNDIISQKALNVLSGKWE
jgi:peptidoglycan hydrolase-like protein with peptidoglycan-binding domain